MGHRASIHPWRCMEEVFPPSRDGSGFSGEKSGPVFVARKTSCGARDRAAKKNGLVTTATQRQAKAADSLPRRLITPTGFLYPLRLCAEENLSPGLQPATAGNWHSPA